MQLTEGFSALQSSTADPTSVTPTISGAAAISLHFHGSGRGGAQKGFTILLTLHSSAQVNCLLCLHLKSAVSCLPRTDRHNTQRFIIFTICNCFAYSLNVSMMLCHLVPVFTPHFPLLLSLVFPMTLPLNTC